MYLQFLYLLLLTFQKSFFLAGDYSRPFQIRQFLRDLHAAYSLLFPKNELRKKFDELKYALKKTEEVVYNLTLRGLKPQEIETSG